MAVPSVQWFDLRIVLALCAGGVAAARTSCAPQAPGIPGVVRGVAPLLSGGVVENAGQWHEGVVFGAATSQMTIGIGSTSIVLRPVQNDGRELRLSFRGSSPECRLVGEELRPERFSFIKGSDPARWRHGVRCYESLICRGLYDGVDLLLRRSPDGRVHYDLALQPGADPRQVVVECVGFDAPFVAENGDLLLAGSTGVLRQSAPIGWEERDGTARPVRCSFRRVGDRAFGFELHGARGPGTLIIDPGLTWSTYFGGSGEDAALDVARMRSGELIVVGTTRSGDLPVTPGAYDPTFNGGKDIFVARLSAAGQLRYATLLGGVGEDSPGKIAIDRLGHVVIPGSTDSPDYPTTTTAYDRTANGNSDAFLSRLSVSGGGLIESTYIGGPGQDYGAAVALAPDDSAIVVGSTSSGNYPTTAGALQTVRQGVQPDGVVTRVAVGGSALVYSTLLGGFLGDACFAVVTDATGAATVAGATGSTDFPTTPGAHGTTLQGGNDGFIARLDPSGSSLVFSTYIGGSDGEGIRQIAMDAAGAMTVTGFTTSWRGLATKWRQLRNVSRRLRSRPPIGTSAHFPR